MAGGGQKRTYIGDCGVAVTLSENLCYPCKRRCVHGPSLAIASERCSRIGSNGKSSKDIEVTGQL